MATCCTHIQNVVIWGYVRRDIKSWPHDVHTHKMLFSGDMFVGTLKVGHMMYTHTQDVVLRGYVRRDIKSWPHDVHTHKMLFSGDMFVGTLKVGHMMYTHTRCCSQGICS